MTNAEWGAFISHPNDIVYEPTYNFNFTHLTLIGNLLGRNTKLLYVIDTTGGTNRFGYLYETGTNALTAYHLTENAVYFHPYNTSNSAGVYKSRCDSNTSILSAAPTTGNTGNVATITYTDTENQEVTINGAIMFNNDLPLKFIDSGTLTLYMSNGRALYSK